VNSPHALTGLIKAKALELGFAGVGISRAEVLADETSKLREWLGRGYEGTMGWMRKNLEKRGDVRLIVPDAKSVVSLALNYYSPQSIQDDPATGKISRYAWGDDYHIAMTARIQSLVDCIL